MLKVIELVNRRQMYLIIVRFKNEENLKNKQDNVFINDYISFIINDLNRKQYSILNKDQMN